MNGYIPPWLKNILKERDPTLEERRGYKPPAPMKPPYVPSNILGGGIPGVTLPQGKSAGGVDIGIGSMMPDFSGLKSAYASSLPRIGQTLTDRTGPVTGLSAGLVERIKRKKAAAASAPPLSRELIAKVTGKYASPTGVTVPTSATMKEPHVSKPRLMGGQQQMMFGSFADYQMAAEARKHGYIPNRYDDIADYLETDPDALAGTGAGYNSGYSYYPGEVKKEKPIEQYQGGHRPDWKLWATFVTATTWDM